MLKALALLASTLLLPAALGAQTPDGSSPLPGQTPSASPTLPASQTAPASGPVVGTEAPQTASPVVAAADENVETHYAEFVAEGTNPDGSTRIAGWDAELNVGLAQGHVAPAIANQPMGLAVRMTTASPVALMAQSTMYFGGNAAPNDSACVGFNNATPGNLSKTPRQRFAVCLGRGNAFLLNGGTVTPLNFPNATTFVTVTFWLTAAGDLDVSMVQAGTNGAVTNTLTGITPPAKLTNFEISGKAASDQQYGSRYAVSATGTSDQVLMAYDGGAHAGGAAVLTSATAGGVFALIPPDYDPHAANRAVVYLHGLNEAGWSVSCQAPYGGCNQGVALVARGLMDAGYVVIGINGTDKACYGNATCMTELRAVLAEFQAKLALSGGLYGFAESMGGFQMLNGIAQGIFAPRAIASCCLNTNLADDYFPTYTAPGSTTPAVQAGSAKPLIDTAYHVTEASPYATATADFDPMLATGAALDRLVRVPAMLWASATDPLVNRTYNPDQYAAMINAAGGSATVVSCTGGHEDLSCFRPDDVVAFFDKH